MSDDTPRKRPDYAVMASRDSDDPDARLCEIGIAFNSSTRKGKPYIAVILHCKPWGRWDGKLQLYPIEPRD